MICKNCQNSIPDDSNVCEFCGTRIKEPGEQSAFFSNEAPAQENNQQNTYNSAAQNSAPSFNAQPAKEEFNEEEHVSTWQWLGIMAINFIPCVGPLAYLIMMFVWGFGSTPKHSLKTYARASLIMMLIATVLWIILFVIIFAVAGGIAGLGRAFEQNGYYY